MNKYSICGQFELEFGPRLEIATCLNFTQTNTHAHTHAHTHTHTHTHRIPLPEYLNTFHTFRFEKVMK